MPIPTSVPECGKHQALHPSRLSCLDSKLRFDFDFDLVFILRNLLLIVLKFVLLAIAAARYSDRTTKSLEDRKGPLSCPQTTPAPLPPPALYRSLTASQASHPPDDDRNLDTNRFIRCRRRRVDWDLFRLHSLPGSKISSSKKFGLRLRKEISTLALPLPQLLL